MFGSYVANIFITLFQKNFKPVWFNQSNMIDDDTKYIALGKSIGDTFYIINFINGKYAINNYIDDFISIKNEIKVKTIFLHIIVSETQNDQLLEFVHSSTTKKTANINSIFWYINLDNPNKIISNNAYTKRIKYFNKIIINNKFTNNKVSIAINNLMIQALLTDPLKSKSHLIKCSGIFILITLIILISMSAGYNTFSDSNLLRYGALSTIRIQNYGEFYRLISSIFLYDSYFSFIFLSIIIYVIGTIFEKYCGHIHLIGTFIISALVGNIFITYSSNGLFLGPLGGAIGIVGSLMCISSYYHKDLHGLNIYNLGIVALALISFSVNNSYISTIGTIASFLTGIILGIFIIYELKNKTITFKI